MTFDQQLTCPVCGREGRAKLRLAEALSWMRHAEWMDVEHLSDGFEAVARPSAVHTSLDIECSEHRVSAFVGVDEIAPVLQAAE